VRCALTHKVCVVCVVLWCEQSKAKFPGRQLVYVSNKWGFTPFPKDVFQESCMLGEKVNWRGDIQSLSLSLSLSQWVCVPTIIYNEEK
jgi:hypothetical protein